MQQGLCLPVFLFCTQTFVCIFIWALLSSCFISCCTINSTFLLEHCFVGSLLDSANPDNDWILGLRRVKMDHSIQGEPSTIFFSNTHQRVLFRTRQKIISRTIRISSMSTTSSTKNSKMTADSESDSVIRGARLELQGAAVGCAPLEIKSSHTRWLKWQHFLNVFRSLNQIKLMKWVDVEMLLAKRDILECEQTFVSPLISATFVRSMCLGSDVMGRRVECSGWWCL